MKRLISLILVISLFSGSAVAQTGFFSQNGQYSIDNGTLTVESIGDDFYIEADNDASLRYTNESDWNRTLVDLGDDRREIRLEGASAGDSGGWEDTGVRARTGSGQQPVQLVVSDHTENTTEVTLEQRQSTYVFLESDTRNDVTMGPEITRFTMTDVDLGNTTIEWESDGIGTVSIDEIYNAGAIALIGENGTTLSASEVTTNTAELQLPPGSGEAQLIEATPAEVDGVELTPRHQWVELTANEDVDRVFQINNTANETREISFNGSEDWIETNGTRSIAGGGSDQIVFSINGSKMEPDETYLTGSIDATVGDNSTSIDLSVDRSIPETEESTGVSIPVLGEVPLGTVLIVLFSFLFVVFVGGWVWVTPRDNDNLWV